MGEDGGTGGVSPYAPSRVFACVLSWLPSGTNLAGSPRVFNEKGGGDRGRVDGELLRSEEEFCSADDYTCRADAAPAASALARQSH